MAHPASSRPETSVLFSLRELRGLEDERREREARLVRDAEAARLAERIAVALREREAIAAAERAERDERLRIVESREAAERAARIAVEQAEATERARLAAQLEEQRFAQELELRRAEVAKKRPTWMLVVTGIAVFAAMGLIWFAVQRQHASDESQAETEQAQRDKAAAVALAEKARGDLDRMDKDLAALDGRVKDAIADVIRDQTAYERQQAAKHLADLQHQEAELRERRAKEKAAEELRIRRLGLQISGECANSSLSKKCP